MSDELQMAKDMANIAAPFTKAIVDTWVKPKLEKLIKRRKLDSKLISHAFTNQFEEYLNRSYKKHYFINTLVFQNRQKALEDLYVPLTITASHDKKKKYKIDKYRDDLIAEYRRVLITDTAGMGKSTMMKRLFLYAIRENRGIPVLIELRKLKESHDILDEIYNELDSIDNQDFDEDFVLSLIKRGDFIFFLDGYDEIPVSEKEAVTNSLQDFISKAEENLFVLTSRPDSAIASFGGFQEFNINNFVNEEAFDLIRKYDQGGEISKELIAKLQDKKFENVHEFLTNPLLVSLLYKAYDYKAKIPLKMHVYYRQVFDALFESHDLAKGGAFARDKRSGLDIDDFHKVMKRLGFITLVMGIEYSKDDIIKKIAEARSYLPNINFKESDFLNDLVGAVPLFNKEGNFYKWNHKSLQEYFAAQFICNDSKEKQANILTRMSKSKNGSRYWNTLALCYDIDYKTFRQVVVYDFVRKFISYYEAHSIKAQRMDNEKDNYDRIGLTFTTLFEFAIPGKVHRTVPACGEERFIDDINLEISFGDESLKYTRPKRMAETGYEFALWRSEYFFLADFLSTRLKDLMYDEQIKWPSIEPHQAMEDVLEVFSSIQKENVRQLNERRLAFFARHFPIPIYEKCKLLKMNIESELQDDLLDDSIISEL